MYQFKWLVDIGVKYFDRFLIILYTCIVFLLIQTNRQMSQTIIRNNLLFLSNCVVDSFTLNTGEKIIKYNN